MGQTALISCYKTCPRVDLKRVASFFKVPAVPGSQWLMISGEQIGLVSGYAAQPEALWIYKFGCICLLGLEEPDTSRIFKTLEASGIHVDSRLAAKYQDRHQLEWDSGFSRETMENAAVVAAVLAKSTELWTLEDTVDRLVDQSERILTELQRGSFRLPERLLELMNLDLIRLQYDLIQNLKILDRPPECNYQLDLRELYDQTAGGYEIRERFAVVQSKMADLLSIIIPYEDQVYSWKERRVAILETGLIALFPVSYLIQMIIRLF